MKNYVKSSLNQYFTPTWAAELLVKRHFPDLNEKDIVLDPSCGDGRFLMAIPQNVDAYGIEIDEATAEFARLNSGRNVIHADFMQAKLPCQPTAIVGNPPFQSSIIDDFMDRCYDLLDYNGRIGFILPVYYLQTASKVVDLSRRFSIAQELLPRNIFENMAQPIMWCTFTKTKRAVLSGFFLYAETHAIKGMHRDMRSVFVGNQSKANCWRDAVAKALEFCGGRATLKQIYACIEGNRPTENPWWREKVRQIAGMHFHRVAVGEYSLERAAA